MSLHPHLCGCLGRMCIVGPCVNLYAYSWIHDTLTFFTDASGTSEVEHTSIGPGSGARDYNVPTFHKVAAACKTGVWNYLIRFHCDTQTMVHVPGLDRTLDRQFFGMLKKSFFFGVHCTVILYNNSYFANWGTFINFALLF